MRSTYLDNTRNIGPRHKSGLQKQIGQLDDRLKAAGLEMPTDFYIERVRAGKRPDVGLDYPLAGQFMIDPETGALSDRVEKSLAQPDQKFIKARTAFHSVDTRVMRRILGIRIVNDPNYATILFVEMLCCVRSFSIKSLLTIAGEFGPKFWRAVGHGEPKA